MYCQLPRYTLFPYTTLFRSKTEQILLSEEMLPVARRWVENYQRWWDALEKVSEVNRRLLRLRAAELIGSKEGARKTSSTGKDRKSTRLNSSHTVISYAVFCL